MDEDVWCNIPNEVIVKILAYCSIPTLYNVMRTSKKLCSCANAQEVWKAKLSVLCPSLQNGNETYLNQNHSFKEICQRFIEVFGVKFENGDLVTEDLLCLACGHIVCRCDKNTSDHDEMIVFDFGSKTTWFKYTSSAGTGQLSMHPTISLDAAASQFLYDESCPVCARSLFQRSVVQQHKKQSKTLMKFRNFDCFSSAKDASVTDAAADSMCQVLPHCVSDNSITGVGVHSENTSALEFLICHMLKRNPFFHVRNIPFVICEPSECTPKMKGHLIKLLLCHLKVPELCFIPKPVAVALYTAMDTCIIVDSGANNTYVTPIVNQHVISDCVQHVPVGGSYLSQLLLDCIHSKGLDMNVSETSISSSQVKRECYVAYNMMTEVKKKIAPKTLFIKGYRNNEMKIVEVSLSHELYQAPESMYLRLDIPSLIFNATCSLPVSYQRRLLSNIILTGGNSRLTGLGLRLTRDLESRLPASVSSCVHVIDPRLMTGRSDAVIGAAYIHKWPDANWITRRDYVVNGLNLSSSNGGDDDDNRLGECSTVGSTSSSSALRSELTIVNCCETDFESPADDRLSLNCCRLEGQQPDRTAGSIRTPLGNAAAGVESDGCRLDEILIDCQCKQSTVTSNAYEGHVRPTSSNLDLLTESSGATAATLSDNDFDYWLNYERLNTDL